MLPPLPLLPGLCAQVSAVALDLLEFLAGQHTASGELQDLLLEGPAGAALMTCVGKCLHTQPSLFRELAVQCKVGCGGPGPLEGAENTLLAQWSALQASLVLPAVPACAGPVCLCRLTRGSWQRPWRRSLCPGCARTS
jgi:hypothetical protein